MLKSSGCKGAAAAVAATCALCALPRSAGADDAAASPAPAEATAAPAAPVVTAPVVVDKTPPRDDASRHAIDRTWLYLDDARTPAQWAVIATTSASYTSVGNNPDPDSAPYRAFAFNTAQPGALLSLGAEVGLLSWLSVEAHGQVNVGGAADGASPGAIAGVRARLTPESWKSVHVVASAGYLRETWAGAVREGDGGDTFTRPQSHGDNGAWAQAAISADIQRLRLGLTAHGEHVFADGRDGVDVMLKAGVNYRFVNWLRAGVEYVGQDLEETFADGAEGGPRHFIGPTVAVQLLDDRLTLVGGPSVGLSTGSPQLLGRLAVAYGF
jgi:hypothetical protein